METRGKIPVMDSSEIRAAIEATARESEARTLLQKFGSFGDVERRTFTHTIGETRMAGTSETGANDGSLQIIGHAAVFGKPSVEMSSPYGAFTETIDARAFDNVLSKKPDVLLTWDHDTRYTLGRTANNTLDLKIDGAGLRYWSRVADTSYARDLKVLMDGGYLNQSSFLFRIAPGGEEWTIWEDAEGREYVQRTILEVGELFDVCVCAAGAYPDTDSGIMRTFAFDYAMEHGFITARKAIPFKSTAKADPGAKWDAGSQTKGATPDDLMKMCAWYDPEKKDADGNLLAGAFKLPHHNRGDGYPVVLAGVHAAMARLNQSGTQIPDSDRQGVYAHLKKHYAQFDQEAPALRSRADIEAESRRVTDELRAVGDVAWGPEAGVDDLICDLECAINGDDGSNGPFADLHDFSVCDVAVAMDKAIVCDWSDFSFWVVPFDIVDQEPIPADRSEWVQVETAWVTTAEGYEANIRSAKIRREARMADETTVETEVEETEVEAPVEEAEATEAELAEAEAQAAADAEAEAQAARARKAAILAEARARIERAKTA